MVDSERQSNRGSWLILGILLFLTLSNLITLRITATTASVGANKDDSSSSSNPPHRDTHWCVISKETSNRAASKHPDHFPHAAENLLPCWSWFRSQNATSNCGFVFLDDIKLDYGRPPNPWQKQLVDFMGCSVAYRAGKNVTDPLRPLGFSEPVQHTIFKVLKAPRCGLFRYLNHPDDAQALRRLLVSDEWIDQHRDPQRLHVGVIERTGSSRVFVELDELVSSIIEAFPDDTVVNVTTLNTPNIVKQAEWFAIQDVVFAAHGAALTNSIFLRPQSVVMQFYPKSFFYQSLDPLIEQSGSIALDWYPERKEGKDPNIEMSKNSYRQKLISNKNNITFHHVANGSMDIFQDVIRPVLETLYSLGKLEAPPGKLEEIAGFPSLFTITERSYKSGLIDIWQFVCYRKVAGRTKYFKSKFQAVDARIKDQILYSSS